ncbi:MAG: carboxypeptidase regulatory-like domain-containing protein [Bacteroidetes bacterium]|nr:carboxypeptidase regulatory-like domain-containing protein [Bacteroidota bacterium]
MKKLFLIFCLIPSLFVACSKHDNPVPGPGGGGKDTAKVPGLPVEGVTVKTSIFGRIVDENDAPLTGVTVSAGGTTTTTDVNGIYMLTDVMMDQARAYVTATMVGYFKGSRIFQPVVNGMSRPMLIKMLARKSLGSINASSGGSVESKGGVKIELPAGAIEGYTGQVSVVASYVNPTSPDFFARMPGDMAADNAQNKRGSLISYGMADIDLLDDKGEKVKIKAGMQATVTLPVPQSLRASATSTIAMWYFDETKGIWKEEGSGTYQNGKYVGKVSHFSVWNYDHFNLNMNLPMVLRWILSKLSSSPPEDLDNILNHPPDFLLTVRDKNTNTTLYSNVFPPPTRDANVMPPQATSTVTFPLPNISDRMILTVAPVQPGGPDYPTNPNYSPTDGETPPPAPTFATEQESVSVEITPTTPPTTITITLPPSGGGGGNGETVVNVNGKAVNCSNQPVTRGYAFMSMRSGNTIVKSTTAPVYGTEGRFTAQYVFYNALPNRVDNVVLTVYDLATGKKTQDLKFNVNPSVAYMIADPVKVCDDNGPVTGGKVYNGNYSINDAASLKAFIDGAYTEVNGMLYVSNVSDLGGIIKLKKVWGLELRNGMFTSLGGLAELEDMSFLTIVACSQLTNAAFPKLANKSMQGIHINNNLGLVGLTLPSIEAVSPLGNDNISITGNPLLKTLSIPNLKSVDKCGNIEITNTLLTDLNTFSGASGTVGGWGLTLVDNPELISVAGIKNIVIQARLTLDQLPKLTNLNGLNIMTNMTDWVSITRNDVLTDISAVSGKLQSTGGLTINLNNALTAASFPVLVKGSVTCKENPILASLTMPVLKDAGGIDINHNVKLASINMNSLETAPSGVSLWGGYETVQALTAFDLPALKSCGAFNIVNCPAITNLDGFNNLTSINGDMNLSNGNIAAASVKLKTINGFNKLASVPFSLNLETASGAGYTGPLTTIKGFQTLKSIGAMFNLGGVNLTDISGFGALETIGQDFRIVNTGLTGLEGLAKLKSSGLSENRSINIQGNQNLTSLKGLASLTNITGIYFFNNKVLKDLQGLEKVTSIRNGITITVNEKLTNVDGLANVGGAIYGINISENPALSGLCGITKLVKDGGNTGDFRVSGNLYNPTAQEIKDGKCSK